MITKEGLMVIEDGKFFLYGFHFKGNNNFEDMRRDMISYIENILTEENFVPVHTVNVSGGYQEPEKELPL